MKMKIAENMLFLSGRVDVTDCFLRNQQSVCRLTTIFVFKGCRLCSQNGEKYESYWPMIYESLFLFVDPKQKKILQNHEYRNSVSKTLRLDNGNQKLHV